MAIKRRYCDVTYSNDADARSDVYWENLPNVSDVSALHGSVGVTRLVPRRAGGWLYKWGTLTDKGHYMHVNNNKGLWEINYSASTIPVWYWILYDLQIAELFISEKNCILKSTLETTQWL